MSTEEEDLKAWNEKREQLELKVGSLLDELFEYMGSNNMQSTTPNGIKIATGKSIEGMETKIQKGMRLLKEGMKEDTEYAHTWHCNLSMACYDAGTPIGLANDAARRFMKNCFDVETSDDMLSKKAD